MRERIVVATLVPLAVVTALGGYAFADAADAVPGWVTMSPAPVPPAPFLTAAQVEPATAPGTDVWPLFDPSAPLPDAAVLQALVQDVRGVDEQVGTRVV